MSDKLWFWRREGTVYGPVDELAFEKRIESGRIVRGDPIRLGTGGSWQRIENHARWLECLEDAEARGVRRKSRSSKQQKIGVAIAVICLVLGVGVLLRGPARTASESNPLEVNAAPLPPPLPVLKDAVRPEPVEPPPKRRKARRRKPKADKIVIGSNTAPNDGGLSGAAIAEGFRRGLPRIQACAKRYATGGGQIPSKMAVSYSIRNSGSVTEAKVRPHEISQTPLGRCIVGVLRRLQYPSYRGEARTVSFPLAFNKK